MDRLRQHFDLTGDAEIAVEVDPRGLDEERARALAAAGVTVQVSASRTSIPRYRGPSTAGSPMMLPPAQ
jgi:hypothetical protein